MVTSHLPTQRNATQRNATQRNATQRKRVGGQSGQYSEKNLNYSETPLYGHPLITDSFLCPEN